MIMIKGSCVCKKRSEFTPSIVYKNETVFKAYEGNIIGKCVRCGLLKTFPSKKNKKFDPICTKADLYEERKQEFAKLFLPIVRKVQNYSPGKKVLDVGCSSGILLALLKKDKFDIYGIEPNSTAFALSSKRFKNRIHNGTLASFLKKNKSTFDCVIYNHVLEHVPDIQQEFLLIRSILKPGGILIIGVPNTSNFIFRIRRKFWESLLPNEHIWHFSAGYLNKFLKLQGFDILDTSFNDDARRSYPLIKRIYFNILSLLNILFRTGEAVLITARIV